MKTRKVERTPSPAEPQSEAAAIRAENARLRAALAELVRECTPPSIPSDGGKHYGVRMPSRAVVDQAHKVLEDRSR